MVMDTILRQDICLEALDQRLEDNNIQRWKFDGFRYVHYGRVEARTQKPRDGPLQDQTA